jgi:hypothetical protein
MISKLVTEFATLQKDEKQREKERLRELEQELARGPPARAGRLRRSWNPSAKQKQNKTKQKNLLHGFWIWWSWFKMDFWTR